jgi:outer membrane protein assembly factor BamE
METFVVALHARGHRPSMRKLLLCVLLLAGCQRMPNLPGLAPHQIDIQQGNYVTQEMVAKLKPGMSRSQVRFALGTPLVADPFHSDRWDYVYVLQKEGRVVEQRHIAVIFQDDKLQRIDGDVKPASGSAKAEASRKDGAHTPDKPAPASAAPSPK